MEGAHLRITLHGSCLRGLNLKSRARFEERNSNLKKGSALYIWKRGGGGRRSILSADEYILAISS